MSAEEKSSTNIVTTANASTSFWDWSSWSEWGSSIMDNLDKFFSEDSADCALTAIQDLFTPPPETVETIEPNDIVDDDAKV